MRHFLILPTLYIFFLIITIIVGTFIPRLLAYLPPFAGLFFTAIYFLKEKKFFSIDKTTFLFLIAVVSWAALSTLWSFNAEFSMERSIKIAFIILPAFLLWSLTSKIQIENINQFTKILVCVFSGIVFCLTLEKYFGHPVTEYIFGRDFQEHKSNRSFTVLALLAIPVLFLIQKTNWPQKKPIQFIMILFVGTAMTQTISQTAQLCFIIGLILMYLLPPSKIMIKLFFVSLIILTIALPFAIKPVKNAMSPENVMSNSLLREASIVHRFEIWEYSVDMAFEKPILGNGIGSLRFMTSKEWMTYQRSDKALHSHNVILQLWVEFGVIGALMMIAFLIISMKKMLRVEDTHQRRIYFTTYVTILSCIMTGYGFWQSWHLGMIMFLAVLALFVARQKQQS